MPKPDAAPCRVILLGMMGSGKTTIGRALAERIGWPYHDNDALLARATGRTARELALDGQAALREAEGTALRLAMREPEPSIVAAAAGVVLDPALRAELARAGIVAWLHAPPEALAGRAERGAHRPWLDDDAVGWMLATARAREPLYREVSDLEIDTYGGGVAQAVDRLVVELARRGCARATGTGLARSDPA